MGIITWLKKVNSNTLYYPGCLTKSVLQDHLENYKQIFNILGIDFIILSEDICCGMPALNAGYSKDTRELAKKNFELFKKYNVRKIITNCPSCYSILKFEYPKLVREWDIEVEHATVTILNALKNRRIPDTKKEKITYHDPCHLGRYSEIYDAPRQVLQLLGAEIIEMKHSKDQALCCGAGAGLQANYPDMAKNIAKLRISEIPRQAEKIVSPCGLCSANLKSATDKSEEFSSFVLRKIKELKLR